MLRYILAFVILIHGLFHLLGFARAFNYGNPNVITKDISRPSGMVWLATAVLLILTTTLYLLKKDILWTVGLAAVILSQVLIVTVWKEAKLGTIVNIIVLLVSIDGFGAWIFERTFRNDVSETIARTNAIGTSLLTEQELAHLPSPVQNYLKYAGVLNKPKINNVRILFEGRMREKGKKWFSFTSAQYNSFDLHHRFFFMKGKMYGMRVPGYHAYKNGRASMQVRLFGIFPIISENGSIMDQAETVTVFNDMCLFAPATLIDRRISWQQTDSFSVKATFTVNRITISAFLYFNKEGQLVNFISDDRYAIADRKQYRFSTPVQDYKNINGYNLPLTGETVWHYPDGPFTYAKFHLKSIEYNVGD